MAPEKLNKISKDVFMFLLISEGDRQSVLRTTKVRTALKGDASWIQRQQQAKLEREEEEKKEKPW